MNSTVLLCGGAALMLASIHTSASVPMLNLVATNGNDIALSITNLTPGGTYYIEHSDQLVSNDWTEILHFEGINGSTNWMTEAADSGFYRAVRDPYHPKVGKIADFGTGNAHDVSGTAHIINNRTIELRNFNFDGGGIYVQVWLSESGNFPSDYIAISGDLIGTVFTDATVQFEIPEGADLDNINYISIWCVPAGASFGDGPFQ